MGLLDSIKNLFKQEKRPGAPTSLTAGNSDIDPRNSWTPDLNDRPEEEVVAFGTMLHDQWLQARSPYEPVWATDMAFYVGEQWSTWDADEARLKLAPTPSWRRQLTINKIMPVIRTLRGKINKSVHKASVFPLQQTDTAYADARMGERVLRSLHEMLTIDEAVDEAVDWALITGNGFAYVGFDPDLGDLVELPDGSTVRTGEVTVEPFGPFEALAPSDTRSLRNPGRFIRVKLFDIERLRDHYGDAARGLEPDALSATNTATPWGSHFMNLISPLSPQGAYQQTESSNSVYVVELSEDPEVMNENDAQRNPNGRVTVFSRNQGILLDQSENPFVSFLPSQSKMPFLHLKDDTIPGRFWGLSRIDQLVPLQESYNKGRSDMVEARDLTCRPAMNVEQGHGITRFTNRPGAIFERKVGMHEPKYMAPPQMSQYHTLDVTELSPRDFDDVSQVPDVSRGQVPFANLPGVGINLLQEAADTPLSNVAKAIARFMTGLFTKELERVHQFYDEPRMLAYVGENNQEDVFLFLRDKHPTPLKAIITPENVFPESKATRIARVQRDIELQVIDPKSETAIRLLEYGDIDTIWQNEDLDRQNALWENRQMSEGRPVSVQEFDDHSIHLYNHQRFQKSPEWRSLDPISQLLLAQHVQETIAALADEVENAARLTEGAPPDQPLE